MENITDNIMKLYLYADCCKMIHYTTEIMHIHELCDQVRNKIVEFTDDLAEQAFGYFGKPNYQDFTINQTIEPTPDIAKLCKKVLGVVIPMREIFVDEDLNGLVSLIDDFTAAMRQFIYLSTFDNEKINEVVNKVVDKYLK